MKLPVILWAHTELIKLTLHCPACLGCTCVKWRGQLPQCGDCEQKGLWSWSTAVLPEWSYQEPGEEKVMHSYTLSLQLVFGTPGMWSVCLAMVYGQILSPKNALGSWSWCQGMHSNPAHGLESPGEKQREGKMHLTVLEEKQRPEDVLLYFWSIILPCPHWHVGTGWVLSLHLAEFHWLNFLLATYFSLLLQCPLQELHFAQAHKGVFPTVWGGRRSRISGVTFSYYRLKKKKWQE